MCVCTVCKYTFGCMYLAKINNNIKKDVKVQRRRDELELQFCWREMLKTVMETVCNRGSLPKLSMRLLFLSHGPLCLMQHILCCAIVRRLVSLTPGMQSVHCHLELRPQQALNTLCVLLCVVFDFLIRVLMSLSSS